MLPNFTRSPGSGLYTLITDSTQTLLWHHRLGHPSLPCLRDMHLRLLVSGTGAGDPGAGGTRAGDPGAGGAGARGAQAGGAGARDPGAEGAGARGGEAGSNRAGDHGAGGTGGGDPGAGGANVGGAGAGEARSGGTRAGGTGAGGTGAGGAGARGDGATGTGARGAGAGDPGAKGAGAGGVGAGSTGAGGTMQRRPFFVPPPPSSLPQRGSLQHNSPLPAPSPYAKQTYSLIERREPESRPASPNRTGRPVPCPHPPPISGTHIVALRPTSVPLRVPLPSPPACSLADGLDPESDFVRAASPTVTRLLATVLTDPSLESAAASALVSELVDFVAASCLDYAASLLQEDFECLEAVVPHLVAMLLALEGEPDAQDISTPQTYTEAITGTYVDAVPPPGANIVDGMWISRVKRPPGSQLAFKAPYVARVFSQRQGVDFFRIFSPIPKMITLRITRDRARRTITLTQSHMVHQVLQRFGFRYSLPQSTPLPTCHSLSTPPSNESVEPSGPYPELVGCLITSGMGLVQGGRGPVVLTGHADASWVDDLATQWSSQGYTFSLGSGSVSWRSTRSSFVLSFSCEAEIYAGAMAAQELRWLTYLLIDLGELPCSPPFLYVDNKAMIAL
ncbi:unnamed protein product [Closterium sp. NIES-53]